MKYTLGDKIKELREEHAVSQEELAEAVGYKSGTPISLIEKGKRGISTEKLQAISRYLKVDIREFFDDDTDIDILAALRQRGLNKRQRDNVMSYIEFVEEKWLKTYQGVEQ